MKNGLSPDPDSIVSTPPANQQRSSRRTPSLKELNLLCWGALLVGFVLPFVIVILSSHRAPNGDFVCFYSFGRVLSKYPARELYNSDLLWHVFQQVHPNKFGYGPTPYPPFVGLFFRPFAALPFWFAYLLWSVLSIAFYAAGISILTRQLFPLRRLELSLLMCLALAYSPFLVDTASNGQLSAIGFLALAVAIREDDREHRFRSGLAASACLYKPTLLVLLLPMLLVTRRWRTMLGLTAGGGALAAITTVFEGISIWPVFVHSILSYGRTATGAQAGLSRNIFKFVDLTSFSDILHGGRTWPVLVILIGGGVAALIALARTWWMAPRQGRTFQWLMWSATLTWSMLLNIYVPVYDTILIVLAVILMAGALRQMHERAGNRWFTVNWMLILLVSWFTSPLAVKTGVQLLTLLIAAFGILQLVLLRKLETQAG